MRDTLCVTSPKNARAVVVVGTQWGDEGKGKVVDQYSSQADVIVRYQGGNNAGHTLVIGDTKYVLHMVHSGITNLEAKLVIAAGCVVNLEKTNLELEQLPEQFGVKRRLYVDPNTNIITPMQIAEDVARENGGKGVGSTRNGIGPCYEDRVGRRAVTFGDFAHHEQKARQMLEKQAEHWEFTGSVDAVFHELKQEVQPLLENLVNVPSMLREAYEQGKKILFEGAQGTLLDLYCGTYPNVTSSNTIAGGACVGTGIGPTMITDVVGIVKLLESRVGDGGFPTELVDERKQKKEVLDFVCQQEGLSLSDFERLSDRRKVELRQQWSSKYELPEHYRFVLEHLEEADAFAQSKEIPAPLREKLLNIYRDENPLTAYQHILGMFFMQVGQEYGATTGRPRRTGWLDLIALKHAVTVNGLTGLALTKLDCLGDLPFVKVGMAYEYAGEVHQEFSSHFVDEAKPLYQRLEGWSAAAVRSAQSFEELPAAAQEYVNVIANATKVPIYALGTGPERSQVIELYNPFNER